MAKRERLETVLKLKTTKVEIHLLKEKANQPTGRKHAGSDNPIVAVDKHVLAKVVADYEALLRSLKKLGIFFERELHYSETNEWKESIGKPIKSSEILPFLLPPKRQRNKL